MLPSSLSNTETHQTCNLKDSNRIEFHPFGNQFRTHLGMESRIPFQFLQSYMLLECNAQVKCWQIRRQTKAPQAAGAIHTDFERGFICAEVMSEIFFFTSTFLQ